MIRSFARRVRRYLRDEKGTASLEFVMVAPLFFSFMFFSIELGFVTLRATMIERGLDIAVREIRLGTGSAPQHDDIKDIICDNSLIIPDCANKLRLEMVPTDLRNFTPLDPEPDCTDAANESKPLREFTPGGENQLMMLRACAKYTPIYPSQWLGRAVFKDPNGEALIVATSAFVQEPI